MRALARGYRPPPCPRIAAHDLAQSREGDEGYRRRLRDKSHLLTVRAWTRREGRRNIVAEPKMSVNPPIV
jgi:hypothetical protein